MSVRYGKNLRIHHSVYHILRSIAIYFRILHFAFRISHVKSVPSPHLKARMSQNVCIWTGVEIGFYFQQTVAKRTQLMKINDEPDSAAIGVKVGESSEFP